MIPPQRAGLFRPNPYRQQQNDVRMQAVGLVSAPTAGGHVDERLSLVPAPGSYAQSAATSSTTDR